MSHLVRSLRHGSSPNSRDFSSVFHSVFDLIQGYLLMKSFVWACGHRSCSAVAVGVAALLGSLGILAVAVLASAPATSQAATIVWGTPSLIDVTQPTQVVNVDNVYSAAFNNPFTVNSVLFSTAPSTANDSGSGGTFAPVIPGADPSYLAIVDEGRYVSAGGTATATLSGLTNGQTYQLQVFTPYWDASFETQLISGANTVAMGNTRRAPTYVSGLFTADATTQTFDWTANPGSGYGLLAAVNVVAVPEPSIYAMALAGLACGGYPLFRRRRVR